MPIRRDYPPQFEYGGAPSRGDSVSQLILHGGQIGAQEALAEGDIWSKVGTQLAGQIAGWGQRRKEATAQKAYDLATSDQYPSATNPVPGSASDAPDPGMDHTKAILERVSPEMRPKVEKGIAEFQASAAKYKEAQRVAQQHAKDTLATGAFHTKRLLEKNPGAAMTATRVLVEQAKYAGFDTRQYEQMLDQADQVRQQLQGDPAKSAEFETQFQQQAGQMLDELTIGASADIISKFAPKPAGTKTVEILNADGSKTTKIVADTPGQEFVGSAPKKEGKKYEVTVPGPGGVPIKKLVTEEELAAGIRQYEAPKESKDPKLVQLDTVGPDGKPITTFVTPQAGASYPKPASGAARPPTGQERTSLAYYNRAKEASDTALKTEDNIAKYDLTDQARLQTGGTIGNFLKSDEMQSYRQAQRAFTEARLRKESGATIKSDEYDQDARTYWAVPGDSKATIEQKRKARETVLAGLRIGSGRAYQEYYGEEPPRGTVPDAQPEPPKKKANPFR